MGERRPNRAKLFRVTVILASGGFLAACAVDPVEPTAAASGPVEATAAAPAGPVETTAALVGPADPAPVATANHIMSTDIVGPVDLGPDPGTIKTAEIAGPIQGAEAAVHTAASRPHIGPTAASTAGSVEPVSVLAVDPIGPTAAAWAGPVDPAPVSTTNHIMSTDIAGLVDLGPDPATIKTAEIAGPIQGAEATVHTATATTGRRSIAIDQRRRSVIASMSLRKSPRQVAARPAPARKQAKVSVGTRAAGPKTRSSDVFPVADVREDRKGQRFARQWPPVALIEASR
jgi:hypothetical protein